MPTLTGLAALKARVLVVLKAAPTRLIALGLVAATIIQQVSTLLPPGWQDNAAQVGGYITAGLAAAVRIIRQVTPVLEGDVGLLPPDRPAVADPNSDVGDGEIGFICRLAALGALVVVAAIGFDKIHSVYAIGWLGVGLGLWLLSTFLPPKSNP